MLCSASTVQEQERTPSQQDTISYQDSTPGQQDTVTDQDSTPGKQDTVSDQDSTTTEQISGQRRRRRGVSQVRETHTHTHTHTHKRSLTHRPSSQGWASKVSCADFLFSSWINCLSIYVHIMSPNTGPGTPLITDTMTNRLL